MGALIYSLCQNIHSLVLKEQQYSRSTMNVETTSGFDVDCNSNIVTWHCFVMSQWYIWVAWDNSFVF